MNRKKKGQGFFALDVDQFFKIADAKLGIEEAAAYLALMKGTDETNTISRGGVTSVVNYTGLTRSEAHRAIDNLVQAGLVGKLDVERVRAKSVPRYRMSPHETRESLSKTEAALVARIAQGEQPGMGRDENTVYRAAHKGWLERQSSGWAVIPTQNRAAFIPNIFVDADGMTPPLRRLMTVGELEPLMLAVELYYKQDLLRDRGVPVEALRAHFEAEDSTPIQGPHGGYVMYRLFLGKNMGADSVQQDPITMNCSARQFRKYQDFWGALDILEKSGLVEWAVYSTNGKPDDPYRPNRPQRPLGVVRNGRKVQNTPEATGSIAAAHLFKVIEHVHRMEDYWDEPMPALEDTLPEWFGNGHFIAIESAQVSHVEGVGIIRMVYRADTENARQWFRDLQEEKRRHLFFLDEVRRWNLGKYNQIQIDSKDFENAISEVSIMINAYSNRDQ